MDLGWPHKRRPDLILMDIQLPGMSGIEALKVLRADPATAPIPVIAVTASVMQQDRKHITEAGFDAYLGKPIDLKEFLDGGNRCCRARADEQPAKVLVVDDTPENVKLLADLLAVKGYAVATAANGEEALAKVASEKPDLVLLDVMMPGLSGYDVCRRIRADPETALLPVVLVTSLDPQRSAQGHRSRRRRFLSKPINQPELFARVRSLLRIKALQDEVRARPRVEGWNAKLEQRVAEQVASASASPSSSASSRRRSPTRSNRRASVDPRAAPARDLARCSPICAASPRSPSRGARRGAGGAARLPRRRWARWSPSTTARSIALRATES